MNDIVDELYLKITKQEQYSEIQDVQEFVEELPDLMREAVKVLADGDMNLIERVRNLLDQIDTLKKLQENVEIQSEQHDARTAQLKEQFAREIRGYSTGVRDQ